MNLSKMRERKKLLLQDLKGITYNQGCLFAKERDTEIIGKRRKVVRWISTYGGVIYWHLGMWQLIGHNLSILHTVGGNQEIDEMHDSRMTVGW